MVTLLAFALLVVFAFAVVVATWPDPRPAFREVEVRVCPSCVAPLVELGGRRWEPGPGKPFVVTTAGKLVPDDGTIPSDAIVSRQVERDVREIPWGLVCEAHPTDDLRQATNFITTDTHAVHARTAPRRGPLAPLRRVVQRARRWLWWRKQIAAGAVHGPGGA